LIERRRAVQSPPAVLLMLCHRGKTAVRYYRHARVPPDEFFATRMSNRIDRRLAQFAQTAIDGRKQTL
jgi:hypothetical protein